MYDFKNIYFHQVEVDEIIGWDISLTKSLSNERHYQIEATMLDPALDEHPVID